MDYDAFLREVAGELDLAWRKYRRKAPRRAVAARVRELGLPDLAAYRERLRSDPAEVGGLADRMRVTVSRFLRERERWEVLFGRVLPEILPGRGAFRVWSAGCCGGEEPYTFSLLWLERVAPRFSGVALEVVATDIDPSALRRAEEGVYGESALREVPEDLRRRRFTREAGEWRVAEAVRAYVRFLRQNLGEEPPPLGMDLVLCRYLVFTYYRGERRRRAAARPSSRSSSTAAR